MANSTTRELSIEEIKNLSDKIIGWCTYEPEGTEGCYRFASVKVTKWDDEEDWTYYEINNPYYTGIIKIDFRDDDCYMVFKEVNGSYIDYYGENEIYIDDRTSRNERVITFKDPESEVESRIIKDSRIIVCYRDGESKVIDLLSEYDE